LIISKNYLLENVGKLSLTLAILVVKILKSTCAGWWQMTCGDGRGHDLSLLRDKMTLGLTY